MPPWGPIKRRVLIAALRKLGFNGPFSGGKHEFMVRGDVVLTIPNPHRKDIGPDLLLSFCDRLASAGKNGSASERAATSRRSSTAARAVSTSPSIDDRQGCAERTGVAADGVRRQEAVMLDLRLHRGNQR
jgi:hypothetical protein